MKVSSELAQDRRAWSATVRDVVNAIVDADVIVVMTNNHREMQDLLVANNYNANAVCMCINACVV